MQKTAEPFIKRDPGRVIRGITKVASLPTIFVKLDEAMGNPRSTNKNYAAIINEDTAMTARLLRIANSALYNFPAKIETISHAITIIGTQQLRDLVLACSVIKMFENIPEEEVSMELFWRHSIAVGVTARILAGMRRENNVERFLIAGLLHDIGRLILFTEMTKQMQYVVKEAQETQQILFKVEKEVLGFDHAKLGGLLLKTWQLPDRLIDAVQYHHAPMRSKTYPIEASTIHLADIIVNALQLGTAGEHLVPPLNNNAWKQLNLEEDVLFTLKERLFIQYNDAVNFILSGNHND
ncbi:hypothetical protein MNBD_GAMMA16-2314 [hydrothermal vent metagenome]|uniref:HDOD domain-containing protein n=1 Tax=hydrothermal vent metagenome TaxID=652676 RepID=A0A3B0Z761_9ZZZZ